LSLFVSLVPHAEVILVFLNNCGIVETYLLKMRNDGWQTASKIPRRVRTATSEAKFLQAACKASVAPQSIMLMLRYFATGRRWMRKFVGYSTIKTAMYIHVVSHEY
jgi:hypothetical protein